MTLLLGLNRQHYVILVADTSSSYYTNGKYIHLSGSHKLVLTELGLLTAAGYVPIIESVQNLLIDSKIQNTNHFKEIVKNKVSEEKQKIENPNPALDYNPNFLLTYCTVKDNNAIIRLAMLDKEHDYDIGISEDLVVLYPSDYEKFDLTTNEKDLKEHLKYFDTSIFQDEKDYIDKLTQNISANIRSIAQFFLEISNKSEFVNSEMDYCVQLLVGGYIYGSGHLKDIIAGEKNFIVINDEEPQLLTPKLLED